MTDLNDGMVYKTFCLERENYFTPGNTYYVTSLGNYATGGGRREGIDGDLLDSDTE